MAHYEKLKVFNGIRDALRGDATILAAFPSINVINKDPDDATLTEMMRRGNWVWIRDNGAVIDEYSTCAKTWKQQVSIAAISKNFSYDTLGGMKNVLNIEDNIRGVLDYDGTGGVSVYQEVESWAEQVQIIEIQPTQTVWAQVYAEQLPHGYDMQVVTVEYTIYQLRDRS